MQLLLTKTTIIQQTTRNCNKQIWQIFIKLLDNIFFTFGLIYFTVHIINHASTGTAVNPWCWPFDFRPNICCALQLFEQNLWKCDCVLNFLWQHRFFFFLSLISSDLYFCFEMIFAPTKTETIMSRNKVVQWRKNKNKRSVLFFILEWIWNRYTKRNRWTFCMEQQIIRFKCMKTLSLFYKFCFMFRKSTLSYGTRHIFPHLLSLIALLYFVFLVLIAIVFNVQQYHWK